MRIVVTGASGNLGTAVLRELAGQLPRATVVAVARRSPAARGDDLAAPADTHWIERDVRADDLSAVLDAADAVVHLAWAFHPARRPEETWRTNAEGTRRVADTCARAGVTHLVVASSVAAYSPREALDPVDEGWPTDGASAAPYAREKAYVERVLDGIEASSSSMTVTRLRPTFVFQSQAAEEQRRIFAGSVVPTRAAIRAASVLLPLPTGIVLQAVHADDVASAAVTAVQRSAGGAFNLAGDGVLRRADLQRVFGGRPLDVPAPLVRAAVAAGFALRALPSDPRLLDALLRVPMLSTQRARTMLGWQPRHSGMEALRALRQGLLEARGAPTPPLQAS